MKGKKKDIIFLAKRYPPVIKNSSFKVTEQSQEKVIMNMVNYLFSHIQPLVLLTYLQSEIEIPSHLTLQMLKNKVYRLIKVICLMANQSSRFNFSISNIERTTKLQVIIIKKKKKDTKHLSFHVG